MSEWDNIDGFQQWSDKLGELLDTAMEAASNPDRETRFTITRRLRAFIDNSWPNDQAIVALDKIAAQTAKDLMLDTIDERLREIVGRTVEWQQIAKQFRDQAAAAGETAAAIRLEKAHQAARSLTESVHLLQDLRSSLSDTDDPAFAKNVAKAVDTLQKLRAQIERVG